MRKNNLIVLVIFILLASGCTNISLDNVKVKLVNPEFTTTKCGVLSVWVGMKFQRVDDLSEFVGLIQCPEQYGSEYFRAGSIYKVNLKDNDFPDSTENIIINRFSNVSKKYVVSFISNPTKKSSK